MDPWGPSAGCLAHFLMTEDVVIVTMATLSGHPRVSLGRCLSRSSVCVSCQALLLPLGSGLLYVFTPYPHLHGCEL